METKKEGDGNLGRWSQWTAVFVLEDFYKF